MHLRNELYGVILTAFKKSKYLSMVDYSGDEWYGYICFLSISRKGVVSNVIFSLLIKETKYILHTL